MYLYVYENTNLTNTSARLDTLPVSSTARWADRAEAEAGRRFHLIRVIIANIVAPTDHHNCIIIDTVILRARSPSSLDNIDCLLDSDKHWVRLFELFSNVHIDDVMNHFETFASSIAITF